jgi:hypothetical protein
LRAYQAAQEDYERNSQQHRRISDEETRQKILSLAAEFPRVWNDPKVPARERKRMLRLLIDDVTLVKAEKTLLTCACAAAPRAHSCSIGPFPSHRSARLSRRSLPKSIGYSIITVTVRWPTF